MGPAIDRQIVIAFFQLLRNRDCKLAFASVDPFSGEEVVTSARVDTATDVLVLLEKSDESYMSILIPPIDFFWMNPAWAPHSLKEIAGERCDFGMQFKSPSLFCYILAVLPQPNQIPASPDRAAPLSVPSEPLPPADSAYWAGPIVNKVHSVALSTAGDLLVSGHGRHSWGDSHIGDCEFVKLWDTRTGRQMGTLFGHPFPVVSVALSASGDILASASDDTPIVLWDARTARHLRLLGERSYRHTRVAVSADGDILASPEDSTKVGIWNPRTAGKLHSIDLDWREVMTLALSPGGDHLAIASEYGLSVWDPVTGTERLDLQGSPEGDRNKPEALSVNSDLVAAASSDTLSIFDIRTGDQIGSQRPAGEIYSLSLSQQGDLLAGGFQDGAVSVWNARTGALIHTFVAHTQLVSSVALSFDGRHLVTGSYDNHVKLWDVAQKRLIATFLAESSDDWITYTPEGYFIASDPMITLSARELRIDGHQPPLETPDPAKLLEALRS
jgi:WD40 repeat protein